ncbi:MAG: trehalase family glycosidase [Anaerolineales bacterium]
MSTLTLTFDPAKTPFSRYGAYVAVTHNPAEHTLTIHNDRRRFGEDRAYIARFTRAGQPVAITATATPAELTVSAEGGGACHIAVLDDNTLLWSVDGLEVHLDHARVLPSGVTEELLATLATTGIVGGPAMQGEMGYGVENADGTLEVLSVRCHFYAQVQVLQGRGWLDGPVRPWESNPAVNRNTSIHVAPCGAGDEQATLFALRIAPVETKRDLTGTRFEDVAAAAQAEWEAWREQMPPAPERYREMALTCWYNLWSCVVRAEDVYVHDAMIMSKKTMSAMWSWDHCFNALAIARADGEFALHQFLAPFYLQAETGALPDVWTPNQETYWAVTKPPIHGWALNKLLDTQTYPTEVLQQAYDGLAKQARWWQFYRDSDGDGIPEYPQGCDSGWDNATTFDAGFFLESPDLAAHLVLQLRCLARLARLLGRPGDGDRWEAEAQQMLARLYAHSWEPGAGVGGGFVARLTRTHETPHPQRSLLNLIPLVLGDLLDADKRAALVRDLRENYMTPFGPATEQPTSPLYESDGYWRGPIWAPSTYLIVDGLARAGEVELARDIAQRFCDMLAFTAGGAYENFDALTGKGWRAPGYTWTASVFLLLLWEYLA